MSADAFRAGALAMREAAADACDQRYLYAAVCNARSPETSDEAPGDMIRTLTLPEPPATEPGPARGARRAAIEECITALQGLRDDYSFGTIEHRRLADAVSCLMVLL